MNSEIVILFGLVIVILIINKQNRDDYIDFSISKGYYIDEIEIRPRKYVYIDLGVNTGDSLYNFLNIKEKSGGGGKLSSLVDVDLVKNNKWEIYCFEGSFKSYDFIFLLFK
jgi:hypothetical protein